MNSKFRFVSWTSKTERGRGDDIRTQEEMIDMMDFPGLAPPFILWEGKLTSGEPLNPASKDTCLVSIPC